MSAESAPASCRKPGYDYQQMVKCGRKLEANINSLPVVRLALLGDNASQQLINVLKAALVGQQFYPEIYDPGIDNVAGEILGENSGLHAFRPQFVWLNFCSQAYRERFYHKPFSEKEALPAEYCAEVLSLVEILTGKGYQVILNLLARPLERFFGNYSAKTLDSLDASIAEVNRQIVQRSASIHQCYLNDLAYVAGRVGLEAWYNERLWAHSKYLCAPQCFPLVTEGVAAIIRATRGRMVKCLVLDLDNTLWGGVIGDDGLEGIELGGIGAGECFQRFQRYLLQLKGRGLILAVCSKNDPEVALQPFRKHSAMVLKEDDIAVFVANWTAKSANVEYITKVLNLGADSVMFIDDSAFERNEIRQALPAVIVPEMPEDPADFPAFLEGGGYFETVTFSDDDRKRAQRYKEEALRATLQIHSGNIDEYLASLEMRITCRLLDAQHLTRVAQLIQRSNQFNLRTQRLSEGQCKAFMEHPELSPGFYIKLRDKVGDYGLVSAICTRVVEDRLELLEYVMSCRVLGRGVEQYTMTFLVDFCGKRGLSKIRGEYIASGKNKMVSSLYEQFGFRPISASDRQSVWELAVGDFVRPKCFIQNDDPL